MGLFFESSLMFPTVFFSGLLILVLFYWLCAASGLLDLDMLNIEADFDVGMDADVGASGLAGWLTKLGLAGIPVTIILSLFTLFGWVLSYFCVYGFMRFIEPTMLRYFVGVIVFVLTSWISLKITVLCLKPIRNKLLSIKKPKTVHQLIGRLATVRSGTVSEENGTGILEDGGAGLILQIRASSAENLKRGDRVVIISYDADSHSYQVVTEDEFLH